VRLYGSFFLTSSLHAFALADLSRFFATVHRGPTWHDAIEQFTPRGVEEF